MSQALPSDPGQSQVPPPGALNLDHVASFVPDRDACYGALAGLGFAPTPFSLQHHRLAPDGDLVPVGTGNHCVMLRAGYLEYLIPVATTPVATQLRSAIDRYVGAHSIVFGTADPHADHRRLDAQGFGPLEPIALQREVDTCQAVETARFTVVRVAPGAMAEGRIQFCQHHTEQWVWQQRWLNHPNGAVALNAVVVCAADPASTARRYERFTGVAPKRIDAEVWQLSLQRGRIDFLSPSALRRRFGIDAPTLPWIAGCEIASTQLSSAHAAWRRCGVRAERMADGAALVYAPAHIGGVFVFVDT